MMMTKISGFGWHAALPFDLALEKAAQTLISMNDGFDEYVADIQYSLWDLLLWPAFTEDVSIHTG